MRGCVDNARGFIPGGRLGSPREVAEAVLALVYNPCITAQTVAVDGGMHIR